MQASKREPWEPRPCRSDNAEQHRAIHPNASHCGRRCQQRRRRERETANERVVSAVLTVFAASILLATTRWWIPDNGGDAVQNLPSAVPPQ